MKKISLLFLMVFSLIIITSCESDENKDSIRSTNEISSELKSLTNGEIGVKNNGKATLGVNEDEILKVAKEFMARTDLKLEPISAKIEFINDRTYLRIYSKEDYVSTVELTYNHSTGTYWTESTVCTSRVCASAGGCLPNGQYCTECRYGNDGNLKGDCSRSTSGGGEAERETGLFPSQP